MKKFLNSAQLYIWEKPTFLYGIEIEHTKEGLLISHYKFIIDILQEVNSLEVKSRPTFFSMGCKLQKVGGMSLKKPKKF